ncbi:MAG TPA: hypothetical protein VNF29_14940 [Candidatus Binataceae bacterium]|nr:hypothetical protein [Candidatus Binataceae bacterium]HVA82221.1 hypothetical protein [Candidatus Binataceae bacterium]
MSVNPADSEIFGSLFGSSDRAQLAATLAAAAALARAEVSLGMIAAAVAMRITGAARSEILSFDKIAAGTRGGGDPVVELAAKLAAATGGQVRR